jgi:hypothetical protein
MSNLIFLEGISGVGKSSVSAALCDRLRRFGYSADCFLEGDSKSPLDLFNVSFLTGDEYRNLLRSYPAWADEIQKNSIIEPDYALVRYRDTTRKYYSQVLYEYLKEHEFCYNAENPVPLTRFSEVFIKMWGRFAENVIMTQGYLIFDGSLLHHQINDLIRNYNASATQIEAHICALIRTIDVLNPVIFYLISQDVSTRLTQARESRGQTPPTSEQIAFWEKRQQMDLWVLERIPVKSHRIDISDGSWDAALDIIVLSITNTGKMP